MRRNNNCVIDGVLFIIMAGGRGERLRPLTDKLPKPLVPFGTGYRVIDFTLFNCLSLGGVKVMVLTQYLSEMIERHLENNWSSNFAALGGRLDIMPGEKSLKGMYEGTADAVYQALMMIDRLPPYVMVLAGDHVYNMDYRPMVRRHLSHGRHATVSTVPCECSEAHRFGIVETQEDGRIIRFREKPENMFNFVPEDVKPLASMGIYIFSTNALLAYLESNQREGTHDFGRDILPNMAEDGEAYSLAFTNPDGSEAYWCDVGDLRSYWHANMELLLSGGRELSLNFGRPYEELKMESGKIVNSPGSLKTNIREEKTVESVIGPG